MLPEYIYICTYYIVTVYDTYHVISRDKRFVLLYIITPRSYYYYYYYYYYHNHCFFHVGYLHTYSRDKPCP